MKYKIGDIVDLEGCSGPGKIIGYEKSHNYKNINGEESEYTTEEYVVEIGANEFYLQEDAILGLHQDSVEEKVNPLSLNTDIESVQTLIKSFNDLNEKLNKLNETILQLKSDQMDRNSKVYDKLNKPGNQSNKEEGILTQDELSAGTTSKAK